MFKQLIALLFGRKEPQQEININVTDDEHLRKINNAMVFEIAKRKPQQIHRNTFVSGPARRDYDSDVLSPLHPAYFATMADSDNRNHVAPAMSEPTEHHGYTCHDSTPSSDCGSSSSGCCD